MAGRRIIVIGSSDRSSKMGLRIDENILAACSCKFSTVSTASVSHEDGIIQISEAPCSEFELELGQYTEAGVGAFKIGALFTAYSITAISSALQKCNYVHCVLDSEAIFKGRQRIIPEIISAVREKLLPFTTVLLATVPEAKLLLDNAGIPIEYPQDMEDIFDEVANETTLHFVLCTDTEERATGGCVSIFESELCDGHELFYSSVIAPKLVNGHDVPTAVCAAFKFVEAAVREGTLFS